MSSSRGSRSESKRLRGGDQEQDGDFMFTRAKRQKISAPAKEQPPPPPEPEPEPTAKPMVKKGRGRPAANGRKRASPPPSPQEEQEEAPVAKSRRPMRRKRDSSPAPVQEEQLVVVKKRSTRRTTRSSVEAAAEEEQVVEPRAAAPSRRTNGARVAKTENAPTRKPSGRPPRKKKESPPPIEDDPAEEDEDAVDVIQSSPRAIDTPMEKDPSATKIALPFSDTPINNRNKEFRKKGGAGAGGGRRSSMSNRGRRASSLIESGLSAMPHKEVDPSDFYKHIDAAIIETKRMNHLLQWCGERALSQKPQHGTTGTEAILGARAIQDLLLKDFKAKSEFSDWFARQDDPPSSARPARPVVIHPNPINVEHEEKIIALEARIQRLKEQRKAWRALQNPLPQVPPLYPPDTDPKKAPLPEAHFLDADEATMLDLLTNPSSSFAHIKSTTKSRLQTIQSTVEFKVDRLADGIHKMDMRVATAGKQADKVLALSSERLKEREEREREAAGTKDLPVMEVLRSLGRILPPEGATGG